MSETASERTARIVRSDRISKIRDEVAVVERECTELCQMVDETFIEPDHVCGFNLTAIRFRGGAFGYFKTELARLRKALDAREEIETESKEGHDA
jgi:hypothetical protein